MLIVLLVLSVLALLLGIPAQINMIKNSSEKMQRIISRIAIFCMGFSVGLVLYIIFSS